MDQLYAWVMIGAAPLTLIIVTVVFYIRDKTPSSENRHAGKEIIT